MADLQPSVQLAIDEAKRAFPGHWRLTLPERGRVDVYDERTHERVATVYGMSNEERGRE